MPEFGEPLPPAAWDHISDLERRVAELEAALVESNKITYTPKQQGEIARRALEKKGKGLNDG